MLLNSSGQMNISQMGIGDTYCHVGVLGGHFPHNPKEESKPLQVYDMPSIGAVTGDNCGGSPRNKLTPIPMAPVPMLDGNGSHGPTSVAGKGAEQVLDRGGT